MCLWGAAFILFVLVKDQFALLASPSGKMILFTKKKMTILKLRIICQISKKISLSGALNPSPQCHIQHHHHAETSAKNTVPTLECCPCDISGISSSTTTYSMAPAAKLSR